MTIGNLNNISCVVFIAFLVLCPSYARAVDGETFEFAYRGKTLKYTVISETEKTVKTVGPAEWPEVVADGTLEIPSEVTYGNAHYSVTTIDRNAFSGNDVIISVTLPKSLTVIGTEAFRGCTALNSITIPESVGIIEEGAFADCTRLESFSIPEAVTTIAISTFKGCTALGTIEIPNSITTIGAYAFAGCISLKTIDIPGSVKSIDAYSFFRCLNLASVTIPNSVKTIGLSAFSFCSSLTSIEIPNSVETIGTYTFYASSLSSVKFGSGLTTIPFGAFLRCNLTEVVLPPNIVHIQKEAFQENKISNLVIGSEVSLIGLRAFSGRFNDLSTVSVTAVKPLVLESDAFPNTTGLLSVLPDSRVAYNNDEKWKLFESGPNLIPITSVTISEGQTTYSAIQPDAAGRPNQINLTAKTEPANASLSEYIFWESSNPGVATVDGNGVVTLSGADEGSTVIKARTLYAGVSESVTINYDGTIAGVESIYVDADTPERPNDIYNLQGVCIKRDATQSDVDSLSPGVYIIAGAKVVVK